MVEQKSHVLAKLAFLHDKEKLSIIERSEFKTTGHKYNYIIHDKYYSLHFQLRKVPSNKKTCLSTLSRNI